MPKWWPRQEAAHAIQVRVARHVLPMEARGIAHMATTSLALHGILIEHVAQRKAFVLEDALDPTPTTGHPRTRPHHGELVGMGTSRNWAVGSG